MPLHVRPRVALPASLAFAVAFALAGAVAGSPASAASHPGPPLTIRHTTGPIVVDGNLDDAGWQDVPEVTKWFETRVSDSGEPAVRNIGKIAYDDRYFYVALRFDDPHPELIRAPFADHDQLSGTTDYGGLVIDSHNDGKSALLFLANVNGLQYDAVSNDASGEDNSPDFFWESAGKITPAGYQLEMRIPFSTLRYSRETAPTWGVMLYRNYPRDQHYQFFTAPMPRNSSCFICNESDLVGLENLPHGSHLVVAPHASTQRLDLPQAGPGTPIVNGDVKSDAGADVKWSPLASVAIDATIHPDFSQVESDASQITANERFALFYAEKRSFFLEGIDLFATPLQAVYTRSITSPNAGGRVTGRLGSTSFTALAAHDLGQGLAIIPGSEGSRFAPQDFASDVAIARVRHDLGQSSVSLLATGRSIDGGGHNAVFGPDLRWQPNAQDVFAAQALWSDSRTPNRPTFADEWDGRALQDRALLARWSRNTRHVDVFVQGQDIGRHFRADEGFMPQVGFREGYFESGYTWRSTRSIVSRLRLWTIEWYDEDQDGSPLARHVSAGVGMDARWNSFVRIELNHDDIKVGPTMLSRFRPYVQVQSSPSRLVNNLTLSAYFGEELDFDNARKGTGATLSGNVTLHPNDHFEITPSSSARWVNVDDPVLGSGRLFLAEVARLRTVWTFNPRAFVRLIGQYEGDSYNPGLYTFPVPSKDQHFSSSALVAYKVNWQTVVYLGYGDSRALADPNGKLVANGRQAFAKVSYAWQM